MKISIITASYNSGATLRDTLESVLSQSHSDWEHIVIDGASSDNSVEIIRELEPRYKGRLKWISEPDNGMYDAMNKGIAMAEGDVIGILNSDDFYTDSKVLHHIAEAMADTNLDAVFGDIHFIEHHDRGTCVRYYSSRFFRRWMMILGYQPAHPSFYCRRECFDRFGHFDTRIRLASDFEFMLRLIYVNRIRTRYLPLDFVTMRTGGASTMGIRSHRKIVADHYRAYHRHGLYLGYLFDLARYPFKTAILIKRKLIGR